MVFFYSQKLVHMHYPHSKITTFCFATALVFSMLAVNSNITLLSYSDCFIEVCFQVFTCINVAMLSTQTFIFFGLV